MKTDLSVFRCDVAPAYCHGALSGHFLCEWTRTTTTLVRSVPSGFVHAPLYWRRAALLHPCASKMQPSLEMSLRSKALPSAITLKVWWAFIFLSPHEQWSDSCAGNDQIFYFMSEDMKIHQSKITSCFPLALTIINICLSVTLTERNQTSCSLFVIGTFHVSLLLSTCWSDQGSLPTGASWFSPNNNNSIIPKSTKQLQPDEFIWEFNCENCRFFSYYMTWDLFTYLTVFNYNVFCHQLSNIKTNHRRHHGTGEKKKGNLIHDNLRCLLIC